MSGSANGDIPQAGGTGGEPHKPGFQHYYVREPAVPSQPRLVRDKVRRIRLELTTDRGVFSHGRIDFGTKLLCETMRLPPGARVLDLGCGYGVIGIVAAKICPSCHVTMVDINARACRLAHENCIKNSVQAEIICGDARQVLQGRQFDVVLTNPPCRAGRQTCLELFKLAADLLTDEGQLWAVIQTKKGARRYARDLQQWFHEVETVRIVRGYRIIRAARPRRDGAAAGEAAAQAEEPTGPQAGEGEGAATQ